MPTRGSSSCFSRRRPNRRETTGQMLHATSTQCAVLPFAGRSREERDLGFGLAISLATSLHGLPGLVVASHSRVRAAFERVSANLVRHRLRNRPAVLRMATLVGVEYVIFGQVSLRNGEFAIAAEATAATSQATCSVDARRPLSEWWQVFDDLHEALPPALGLAPGSATSSHAPTRSLVAYKEWCRAAARQEGGLALSARQLVQGYERALALDPDFCEPQVWLGVCHAQTGQLALAQHHLLLAARLRPDYAAVWTALAHVYQDALLIADAQEACERALALDDADPEAHLGLAIIYGGAHGNWEREIAELQRVLALDRNCAEAHFNLGYSYEQLGDSSRARGAYERAAQIGSVAVRDDAKRRLRSLCQRSTT